jgi:CRP-like cAMP-binding protein
MDFRLQGPAISTAEKSAMLRRHALFRELGAETCDRLSAPARIREIGRGATIFQKGDPGSCLFAVWRGRVQITNTSSDGKSVFLNQIEEGEIFGEIALLDAQPRTADAVAAADCSLMIIERRDLLPLLRAQPDLAIKMLEVVCGRLRRATEQVEDLTFMDLRSRLAKTLLRLSPGAAGDGAIAISQGELSQIVGLSREMINKQLQVWVREGNIRLERRRLIVLRPEVLARIVAG